MGRKYIYQETADVFPGITARNKSVLEYEKFIQDTFYPTAIHPYSKFCVNWQLSAVFLIAFQNITVPFPWATLNHHTIFYQIFILVFKLYNLLDVILTFFTGYVEPQTGTIVLDKNKIAKRYIFTTFIFDLIPCIPLELISYFVCTPCVEHHLGSSDDLLQKIADFWTIFVVLKIFTCIRYLRHLCKILVWNAFLVGCLTTCFIFYSCLLFAGNLYFVVVQNESEEEEEDPPQAIVPRIFLKDERSYQNFPDNCRKYFQSLLNLVLEFLYNDTIDSSTIYIHSFTPGLASLLSLLFMVFFLKFALLHMFPMEKTIEFKNSVLCLLRKGHLPTALRNKTLLYFYFLSENKYTKEEEIFNYIPDTFKAQIFYEICLPLLKNFDAFEGLPTYVLRCLAEKMKYQLYLPNELIKKDESDLSMYFVLRGTVAYYSAKRVEVYHFEGGSSFNGNNFVLGEPTLKTYAVSIEVTEIYRLDHEDFVKIMKTYPLLLKNVQEKVKGNKTEDACLLD